MPQDNITEAQALGARYALGEQDTLRVHGVLERGYSPKEVTTALAKGFTAEEVYRASEIARYHGTMRPVWLTLPKLTAVARQLPGNPEDVARDLSYLQEEMDKHDHRSVPALKHVLGRVSKTGETLRRAVDGYIGALEQAIKDREDTYLQDKRRRTNRRPGILDMIEEDVGLDGPDAEFLAEMLRR